jgi:sulfoxide reductase heme-binding subunit YedZ
MRARIVLVGSIACAVVLAHQGMTASALAAPPFDMSHATLTAGRRLSAPSPVDDSLRRSAHVAGYIAYSLMVATVVLGLLTTAGTIRRSVRRQTIYDIHMILSIMAITATALHALSHMLKQVDPFNVMQELVPFATPFHVTLGVIAFELMLVAAISVSIQQQLSYHRWHWVHRIAYPAYVLVIVHVLLSAHHRSDGIVIATLATTASVVAIVGLFAALPSIRANAKELT